MSVLRTRLGADAPLVLPGGPVYLRHPEWADFDEWSALRAESRAFLEPWEPTWPPDDLSRSAYRRRIRRYNREIRDETAFPFFIMHARDHHLMGACTLSNVRRGVSQACSLGYWMGERYAGNGYMTAAVRRLAEYVFDDLRLHRIEAATVTTNEASKRVLRRCGFYEEGMARGYLKINGVWQDHNLFALLASDQNAPPKP
jgi:ribosomal-protein-alanine N-acetyltransferase